jgi:hypothetical protein
MPKVEEQVTATPTTSPAPEKEKKVRVSVPKPPEREKVPYPAIEVNGVPIPEDKLRISVTRAKELLGWETEAEYEQRVLALNPKAPEGKRKFGKHFLLKDENGHKVQCWYNVGNRRITESWARSIAQDILNRNYQLNLETIVISRSGRVTSGQHRLVGLVLASQMWAGKNSNHWQTLWDEEPYILSLIAYGGSDDPKVLRTVDNTRPRTLADEIYISPVFSDLDLSARAECSRMLDKGLDVLWTRTGAGTDAFNHYQTHSASLTFLDRHKKLLDCTRFLYGLDNTEGRAVTTLNLSAGKCSALLYLMAASRSDGDTYRNADPPSQKHLDWSRWEKACEFWTALVDTDNEGMRPVREALGHLVDPDSGTGAGRWTEKGCVLARAWGHFLDEHTITDEDLALRYSEPDDKGVIHLIDPPGFDGIDLGPKVPKPPKDEAEEERKTRIREEKAREERERVERERMKKKTRKVRGPEPTPTSEPVQEPLSESPSDEGPLDKAARIAAEKPSSNGGKGKGRGGKSGLRPGNASK